MYAYTLPLKKLYITGKGQKATNALTGKALEETLEAGRDYSVWLREAVPVILKVAAQDAPGDIREMNQRFMCFLLWGDGLNRSPVGLIRSDMSGVDVNLLVPAIRKMITNEDGQMRSYIGEADKFMKGLNEGIRNIEQTNFTPTDLKTLNR